MPDLDITLPRTTVQALFDLVVNGMSFGSGFLDLDDAHLLRSVAVTLGVDPLNAVPDNLAKHFEHPYDPVAYHYPTESVYRCRRCTEVESNTIHRKDTDG